MRDIDLSDIHALSGEDLLFAVQHNMLKQDQLDELGVTNQDIQQMLHGGVPEVMDAEERDDRLVLTDPTEIEVIREFRRTGEVPTLRAEGLTNSLRDPDESTEEEEEEEGDSDEEGIDYAALTLDELQQACVSREPSLSLEGRKRDLVKRLEEDDARRNEAGQ